MELVIHLSEDTRKVQLFPKTFMSFDEVQSARFIKLQSVNQTVETHFPVKFISNSAFRRVRSVTSWVTGSQVINPTVN